MLYTIFIRLQDGAFTPPNIPKCLNQDNVILLLDGFSPSKKNPKYLDPSYKMTLDFRSCFGQGKNHPTTFICKFFTAKLKLWNNTIMTYETEFLQIRIVMLTDARLNLPGLVKLETPELRNCC